MKKRALWLILALMVLTPGLARAAEVVKVAVFPFAVFSREPLREERTKLQEQLNRNLATEGVTALAADEVNRALAQAGKPLDLSLARRLAGRLGADYAVYGSLTKIGSRVSLDAKLLDTLGMRRPQSVFVEGRGLEQLAGMAERLARELASRMSGLERVAKIIVKGNRRIESAAIRAVLATKVGGPFSPLRLDKDLRKVWKMGYFDDVRIETEDSPQGKVIIFVVKEKPMVRDIVISGAKAIDSKDIRDQLGFKAYNVYSPATVKKAEAKILKLYRDKGYYDATVTTQVSDLPSGDKGLKFTIHEGEKVYIKSIRFRGNKAFDADELRDQMTTTEEGWLTWLTDTNVLDRAKLDQDKEKLADFYYNHGYMTARISDPQITREKGGLVVTFDVVEGKRFKVSAISVSGELIMDHDKIMKALQTKAGNWFSREKLRNDLRFLHDLYADRGYAYVRIQPRIKENRQAAEVAIDFKVNKGPKVYFERIIITGNDRTRDNVIRRELGVVEGDLFSGRALRRGNMRLHRLNYFEDVRISTSKGATPELMDLKVHVKEKRTGSFSVGAGYSTVDSLMVMGSITEANLFGRGQRLELRGQLGGKSTRYTLSFTEPWLLDKPVSFGVDLYSWDREYTSYDKEATGGRIRLGWPTPWNYTRLYTYYKYEKATISGVSDTASLIIRDQVGTHTTSSLRAILRRDTRDHAFNPTRGSDNSISLEYAGDPLGGSNAFIKAIGETGWYLPVFSGHVIALHGRIGWVTEHSGGDLPIYEKFFLGGINTLRGFDYHDVGPRDPETGDVIGGEYMLQINLEYRYPLLRKMGLVGVVFFDTGNAWSKDDGYDLSDLRRSAGLGIRWYSPMGPLRLEYGWVLDPREGENTSNWEFSIGSQF